MAELIGRILSGRYEILSLLGEGGMAQVYQARHLQLDRLVAVKVMLSHLTRDPTFAQRFEREARLIAQLHHPHIIQVYDFDTIPAEQLYYMVIELLTGPSLASLLDTQIRENKLFPLGETLRVIRHVASALDYAHKRGMIHRDIKPGNVMLDDQRVVLTDFGLARVFDSTASPSLTATGMVVGTPAYMAPEQVMGMPGDARSDLYSLGVMFYQMVVNQLPFKADTPLAMALQHVNTIPKRPIDLNQSVPPAIERIILRLLDKDPDLRYQSADALVADLDKVQNVTTDEFSTGAIIVDPVTVVLPSTQTAVKTAPTQAIQPAARASGGSRAARYGLIALVIIILIGFGLTVGRSVFNSGLIAALPTSTSTPTGTGSSIPTLTSTGTFTASATQTLTLTNTATNTASPTLSATMSPTTSPTLTATPSATRTLTLSPTATITSTPTLTLTLTATSTVTATATPTLTLTPSSTFSPTVDLAAIPCTVSLINALPITLRTGPGTEYELGAAQMQPKESLPVTGDARDPVTQQAWWRVEDSTRSGWVPFNEVNAIGNCTLVPAIVFAPPTAIETPFNTLVPTSADTDTAVPATANQSGVSFATNALPYTQTAVPTPTDSATDMPTSSILFATNALPYLKVR